MAAREHGLGGAVPRRGGAQVAVLGGDAGDRVLGVQRDPEVAAGVAQRRRPRRAATPSRSGSSPRAPGARACSCGP